MFKISRILVICILALVKLSYLLPTTVKYADSKHAKSALSVLLFWELQLPLSFCSCCYTGLYSHYIHRIIRMFCKQSNNLFIYVCHLMHWFISLSVVFARGQCNYIQAIPLHKSVLRSQGSDELRMCAFNRLAFLNSASSCYVKICYVELCGNNVKLFCLLKSMGQWLIIMCVHALGYAFLLLSAYLASVYMR